MNQESQVQTGNLSENNIPQLPSSPPSTNGVKINKRTTMLIGVGLILFLLVAFVVAMIFSPSKKKIAQNESTDLSSKQSSVLQKPAAQAKLKFDSYTLTEYAKSQVPAQVVSAYTLKDNFTTEDVNLIAAPLGLTNISSQQNGYVASNLSDQDKLGYLTLDKKTGAILAQLSGTQKPSGATVQQQALSQLQSMGVADPSVECAITYQLKSAPGITFVECHRNWQKLNLPLIDFAGVMNMSTADLISKAAPGEVFPNTPTNSDVINVSNGGNGKTRPNDYNTATVGIRADGTLAYINSNLRWIASSTPVITQDIITKNQAINLATNNKSQLYFSMPSGDDKVSWSKIYPNSVADSENATVDEIMLVYLENPSQKVQGNYKPYYLIRGTAFLRSGYTVKFAQALSASKSTYSQRDLDATGAEIASDQLQIDDIVPVFKEPPITAESPPPQVSTICTMEELAKNPSSGYSGDEGSQYPSSVEVPGYGTVGVRLHDRTFYIVSLVNGQSVDPYVVLDAYEKVVPGGKIDRYGTMGCAITTISPAIFLYPETTTNIDIKLGSNVTFTYPYALDNEWSMRVEKGGEMRTGSYLYYEYDYSISDFGKPTSGFIFEKDNIAEVISRISSDLRLTAKEKRLLMADLIQAIEKIDSEYVLVGFASQKAISSNLPLKISPQPETVVRVNLTFAASNRNDMIKRPVIKPILRSGFTVVELGVSLAK